MAACKKNAARLGAHLVFVDESGFLLIPTLRKSWSPRGRTPIVRHHYRRDRASVISGLSISPTRRLIGLYFQCHRKNIGHTEVCLFLRHLLRHLRGELIVLWDRASIHRGTPIRELTHRFSRLHFELLPAYAPQLNPDEGVWAQAKRVLANGRPENLDDLTWRVTRTLEHLKRSQPQLRACIRQSELPPFLR